MRLLNIPKKPLLESSLALACELLLAGGEMVCYNITAYNEIINFTVSKREVYNSKLRAGIKAERGMVMKGKNLERAVILGLLLSTGVYGTAWADFWESDNGKILYGDENLDNYPEKSKLSNFDKIEIDMNVNGEENTGGYKTWSGRLNLPNTDFKVTINGTAENIDGIHLAPHGPHIEINNYTAYINTKTSDAINISHDVDFPNDAKDVYVKINGNLYAEISNGNGIRANASIRGADDSTITVNGKTDIVINGSKIYVETDFNALVKASVTYNPAAVYAGDSKYNFNYLGSHGDESLGQGIINLVGDTKIITNGEENYGIYAGKNGEINANNITIIANEKNSIGIAAINSNLIYDENMTLTILGKNVDINTILDSSKNKYGSTVILNGDKNVITMSEGGKALYANGKNLTDDDGEVIIKSGDNGIGNLDVKGDIVATNSGKIDLTVNKVADITGDIEATNSGIINFTLGDNADMIVSEKDNTLINAGGVSKLSLAKDGNESKIGNVQAANGGTINLTLGDGAYFAGRVDDYKDAGEGNDNNNAWNNQEHKNVFDQEFAKNVTSSGTVNMTLGNNSTWFVTEQSWATTVTTNDSIIDLTNGANQNYAVHIGTLKGKAKFIVNLDPNTDAVENNGNMIYVYNGTEAKDLNLQINNEREVLTGLANGEKLRFATVANAGGGFGDTYVARGRGVINSGFSIEYEKYNTNNEKENDKYNGGTDFDETKPGSDYVDGIYGNGENVYLVRDTSKDAGKSDSGATIINMSRANYKNAIYMDRLNKRMGEMRYLNGEEDQGMWVRLRHDRIGQSGDFRSMNTMYEVGYDVKQPTDNGEHRIGMAIDYMRGSTTYDDIMGKGETKRYGLWLYDTWLGEKGHYTDYIVKWGHLSNDFDIRDKDSLENITGDYSNNVFSVSAEYGKKNDMGNNWYFEPQAQFQLARVTGADYVTTQGSKVNVDGINSLIGRAGFRIGRDMDENSTVYLKADLLHEFMGDQTVTAADATGTLREEFENKGTWYDVGFGFATKMSKNSYAFMDFEKSFGNDNDETYQINAGMQWTF